jgi:hypothetical protein
MFIQLFPLSLHLPTTLMYCITAMLQRPRLAAAPSSLPVSSKGDMNEMKELMKKEKISILIRLLPNDLITYLFGHFNTSNDLLTILITSKLLNKFMKHYLSQIAHSIHINSFKHIHLLIRYNVCHLHSLHFCVAIVFSFSGPNSSPTIPTDAHFRDLINMNHSSLTSLNFLPSVAPSPPHMNHPNDNDEVERDAEKLNQNGDRQRSKHKWESPAFDDQVATAISTCQRLKNLCIMSSEESETLMWHLPKGLQHLEI